MRDLPSVGADAGTLRGIVTIVAPFLGKVSLARVGTCSATTEDAKASSKAGTRKSVYMAGGGEKRWGKRWQNVKQGRSHKDR